MEDYKVFGSERTLHTGNEYEVKSLLFLVSIHQQRKKLYYYFVDIFNDMSALPRDGEYIIDIQSKGDKNMSPNELGDRLITLFKNYISKFDFKDYILVVANNLVNKHLNEQPNKDTNIKHFKLIDNFNDNAIEICKESLKNKVMSYGFFKNWKEGKSESFIMQQIEEFLKEVNIFIADMEKHKYIELLLGVEGYEDTELLNGIFEEIAMHQIFKKSNANIEGEVIVEPLYALRFNRHLNYEQIQTLIIKRVIDNEYIANQNAVPRFFQHYLSTSFPFLEHNQIVEKCKDNISISLFNTNNREPFWEGFLEIFNFVRDVNDNILDLLSCYASLDKSSLIKMLVDNDYDTQLYMLAMIIEGVMNYDKNN